MPADPTAVERMRAWFEGVGLPYRSAADLVRTFAKGLHGTTDQAREGMEVIAQALDEVAPFGPARVDMPKLQRGVVPGDDRQVVTVKIGGHHAVVLDKLYGPTVAMDLRITPVASQNAWIIERHDAGEHWREVARIPLQLETDFEEFREIEAILREQRFTFDCEDTLQRGVALALEQRGFVVKREVRLSARDRIDHLVGAASDTPIGIECKVAGDPDSVRRQLERYADHTQIDALILVTNRSRHQDLGTEVVGPHQNRRIPLVVIYIGGQSL